MINRDDFDKTKERFKALWEREVIDRCCVSISWTDGSRLKDIHRFPKNTEDQERYWTDPEWVLMRNMDVFKNTYYGGDAFPLTWVNLGPSGHAGFLKGIRHRYMPDTIWFDPILDEEELDPDKITFDENSFLYKKTLEMARYLCEQANGQYYVSMPDLSGNLDALAHVRGSDNLLMDFLTEDEDVIRACADKLEAIWEKTMKDCYDIVKDCNDGGSCIGWLNTWAPGFHGQLQCDISVMVSNEIYETFARPELTRQCQVLDYPLYHLDGMEQIRHLDTILSIPGLKMIQWTNVVGQPSPLEFLPALKKIQEAQKCLLLQIRPWEVEKAMDVLSSKGLYLQVSASSKDEVDFVVKTVEHMTHE